MYLDYIVDAMSNKELLKAAKKGQLGGVQQALAVGADIDAADKVRKNNEVVTCTE